MISQIVTLEIKQDRVAQFLEAMRVNAARSVADEPGCRSFSIHRSKESPHHFFLVELYDDQAAIDAHRQAPHFLAWREVAREVVVPGSQKNTICECVDKH